MHMHIITPLLGFCLLASSHAQSGELDTLITRLQATEFQLENLLVTFEARMVSESRHYVQQGTLLESGRSKFIQVGTEEDGKEWWRRGIWDGARLHVTEGVGPAPKCTEWAFPQAAAVRVRILETRTAPPFTYGYVPSFFGTGTASWRWSGLLKHVGDIRVLGRESVLGIDCLVVMFDMDPTGIDDGSYLAPRIAYFDDTGSGLSVRTVSYLRLDNGFKSRYDRAAIDDASLLLLGDTTWVPFEHWDVEAIADGALRLPLSCRLWRPSYADWPDMQVTISAFDALEPAEAAKYLRQGKVAPARVVDEVTQQRYELNKGGARRAVEDVDFERMVTAGRRHYGLPPMVSSINGWAWKESSCGPNAIALLSHLVDKPLSLESVLAAIPNRGSPEFDTSLKDLVDAANASGLAARAIRAEPNALRRLKHPVLVHLTGRPRDAHFAVVDFDEHATYLTSPPSGRERVTNSVFAQVFTGHALVLHSDEALLAEVLARANTKRHWYTILYALAAFFVVIIVYRHWPQGRSQ